MKPRKQCRSCPWKVGVVSSDVPNYSEAAYRKVAETTIAAPGVIDVDTRIMACHETSAGEEAPCVGWLANQLGPGNNIGLRMAAMRGRIDANVKTVGPQHERFEDTLPVEGEGNMRKKTRKTIDGRKIEVRECATLGTNFADVYVDGKLFASELSRPIAETFAECPHMYGNAFASSAKLRTWIIEQWDADVQKQRRGQA